MSELIDRAREAITGTSTIGRALSKKKQQSPQYDYMWRVELPNLDVAIPGNFIGNFMESIGLFGTPSPEDINHRVTSFDSPFFQLDTKKVTNRNTFWYTASNNDIGSITFNIHEMEDGKTLQYLVGWQNLIINEDGTYNPPAFYKKPVRFYRLSATTLDLHEYVYEGFFISEIATMNNTYDGNEVTTYNVTLTGDNISYNFMEGATVRQRVMAKELELLGKSWVNDNVRLSGNGVSEALRKAGSILS